MNIRQMKLSLTVDLMNLPVSESPVNYAKEIMDDYRSETGGFQGVLETNKSRINDNMELKSLALRFEHCTLNLELVEDHFKK